MKEVQDFILPRNSLSNCSDFVPPCTYFGSMWLRTVKVAFIKNDFIAEDDKVILTVKSAGP